MQNSTNIIELEQRYWKAMADKDIDEAVSLTRFPCLISGPQGSQLVTEIDYREMMEKHPMDAFKNIELKNAKVEFVNDDTAIITYESFVKGTSMIDVSTWIRERNDWICAFHSENPRKVY